MKPPETLKHDSYELIIYPATVLIGMRRTRLKIEGQAADEQDPDRRFLRMVTHPDLMAASEPVAGFDQWPLDFEVFLTLPDSLVSPWENTCYRLNPHWLGKPDDEQQEKKEPMPTNSTDE